MIKININQTPLFFICGVVKCKIMDKETVDFLDKKITDIRIQLAKKLDNNALAIVDKMLYDLQIDVFKCEK